MPILLVNGHLQTPQALAVPNGSITFQLNCDATVVASPYGFVPASALVSFQLDETGDIEAPSGSAAATIYSNAELYPQNSVGLGTYYLVTFYDQNNAPLNEPMWWQFTQAAGSTVDIGEMIPFATVGGNVIFYPTSFTIPTPTTTSLGGIYANAGTTSEWVSAINSNGTVTLTQPSFSDISGTLSNAQLPSPITFTSITASGLITAQANLQLGVVTSQTGAITFEGGTSGSCTITGPAVAGTTTNPFLFSNSINIPSGTVFSINTDTGLSRVSAGVIAVGNGTAANASGSIQATALTLGVAGTSSGVLTLSGSTSGTCTITAPATAGTITNPITFSNAIGFTAATYSTVKGALGAGSSAAAPLGYGDGTNTRILSMNLFKGYGFATQTNPTSLTSIFTTPTGSSGSLTLVANQQIVGSVIHIHAVGSMVVSTTSMTINMAAFLNGISVTAVAVASVPTTATGWEFDAWIYCTVVGAASTATMVSTSIAKFYSPLLIATVAPANTTVSSTVATTGTQLVDLKMDFGTSEAGNTCTCQYADVEMY